jgi:hypothetical protein
MSAVPASNVVPLEPKSLNDLLVINDQLPSDFYTNPAYDAQLDKAIEASSCLVYTLDDDGEKKAKADATSINKFATMVDKFVTATYKEQTEAAAQWRDGKKLKIKLLRDNRQRLIDQFEEKRAEKLRQIRTMLTDCLAGLRGTDIKPEFMTGDIEPAVKLNALTPGGKLTAAALKFCKAIYDSNLAEQQRIEARHLVLENRCLRAEINPPLTQAHFGTVFYAEDSLFNEKLEELIAAEVERKAEMEERIRKQVEAESQRKTNDALKAQQDLHEQDKKDSLEQFKAQQDKMRHGQQEKAFPEKTTVQQVDNALAEKRKLDADRKNPPVDPVTHKPIIPGKRTVTFGVTFEVIVSERVSNAGVETHFLSKLPEDLKKIMKGIEFLSDQQ